MNRKNMPLVLMLVAGAITSIITYLRDYTAQEKLVTLLIVLVIFYSLGRILEATLNAFDRENEARREQEGEVIEKEAEQASEASDENASAENASTEGAPEEGKDAE